MNMRITWGKIVSGQWDAFEAAFRQAVSQRGEVKGLRHQWLVQDKNDRDAGYSISLFESEDDMNAFWDSSGRKNTTALLQPFFVNQFTITDCDVKFVIKE